MKFYKRDPDRALAGMSGLNLAQRGAYNSILDLLYSRDGLVMCLSTADDRRIAKNISVDVRTWRAAKNQLLAAGKIRIATDGRLTANGVDVCLIDAQSRSETARKRVSIRWENHRLRNEFNSGPIRQGNTIKSKSKNSEIPSPLEHAKPLAVDNGENSISAEPASTTKSIGSDELKAFIKSKWLGQT
jgi:hypothetical protein